VSGRDIVVIGAGHNGLTAASVLARAGLRVLVVEAQDRIGGAAVTEEFHPGFRASSVAQTAVLDPELVRTLGLQVRLIQPAVRTFAPAPGLALHADPALAAASIRRFSERDADRYASFHRSLSGIAELIARVRAQTPPDIDSPGAGDLFGLLRLARGFRGLGRSLAQDLLRWGPMAVADFAEEWFESEPLRAIVAARGIRGAFAGPRSPGTTANLLMDAAAGDGNGAGHCTFVEGGLGALSDALAATALHAGAEIRTGARVSALSVREDRIHSVILESGEEIETRAVASATDPRRTVLDFIDPAQLDPDDRRRFEHIRISGMASRLDFALSGLPRLAGRSGNPESLHGRIHIGSCIDTLERAFDAAKYGSFAESLFIEATLPTLLDPSLAREGQHVLSATIQYTPYALRESTWERERETLAGHVSQSLEEVAPGFSSLIEGVSILTPVDLERCYGLSQGHPHHGESALDQFFVARPVLGFHRYRGPIPGLYFCSAGTHPGGGVTGTPGMNAAREVLRDLR
jgi:phytoene dehydrogenase-like protein